MKSKKTINTISPDDYRLSKEKYYLWLSVGVTFIYYIWTVWEFINKGTSALLGPAFILGFFILFLFLHLLGTASIRINSVKVGPNQFPEIWKSMVKISNKIGLAKPPDMYVLNNGGELNAFAARLVSRKILVLYSDLADALVENKDQKQLDAVIAHELAHHALDHTHFYNWFLTPAGFIPLLGSALSRSREYSCDKVMKAVIKDQKVCEKALIKLVTGKRLGNSVNVNEYKSQIKTERGFFVWLAEILNSHPHLPKRVLAIST
jgi:Zn-dependent protease with chaperone function